MADFGLNYKIDGSIYLLKIPHYILYLVVGGVLISWVLSRLVKYKQRVNILLNYFSFVDVICRVLFEIMFFVNDLLVFFLRERFGFF